MLHKLPLTIDVRACRKLLGALALAPLVCVAKRQEVVGMLVPYSMDELTSALRPGEGWEHMVLDQVLHSLDASHRVL